MNVVLIATGDIALPTLRHLVECGPRPLALVTQPDKPAGRHQTLTPPAVKMAALAAGITVFQPEKIGQIVPELTELRPDILVVMAYGQILRTDILDLPRQAIINLHASLLPKYRGAACIQAAIDAGDSETGITVMHVIRKLDAGDIILAKTLSIRPDETGGSLHDRLAELAPAALAEAISKLAANSAQRVQQDESSSTYVSKLERDDGRLDWSQDATALERRIRAYDPWPGTFAISMEDGRPKRVKIFPPVSVVRHVLSPGEIRTFDRQLIIGCGSGSLRLEVVQPEGGRRMSAAEFLRGRLPVSFKT